MSLPLDIWRQEMGYNPWHFWGLANDRVPVNATCSDLILEYSWQGSDAAGRDDLRRAIARAENRLFAYLGYRVAPQYAEATVDWPRAEPPMLMRLWDADASGRRVATVAPEGYVQAMGVEQLTPIGTATVAGSTLVYSDVFSTGFADTFTITLPVPVGMTLSADQVAVYVAAADRLDGAAASERWRVQPVSVRVSGGNVMIVGRRWLVVKPIKYEAPALRALDPSDAANFVTSLEVYQRTTNAGGTTVGDCQATLIYESGQCCTSFSSDPATTGLVIARAGIRDGRLGLVTPAASVYDASSGAWSDISSTSCAGDPDRVTLRYLAGYPLGADGQMDARMQQIVTMFAAAELKRRISACRDANERLHDLQIDLTLQATETERYQVSQQDLSNPFGVRKGHVQAWRAASDLYLRRGTTA